MKLFKNNKGFELSISTIVIAVLALIVLLIMIFIFREQAGGFTTGIGDCESKGGDCTSCGVSCNKQTHIQYVGANVCKSNNVECSKGIFGKSVCCIPATT